MEHRSVTVVDSDHPAVLVGQDHGPTPVEYLLHGIAACLTAIGMVLGMIGSRAEWGRFWGWDAKEVGALCVIVWLVFFMAAQRSQKVSARGVLLLTILGNAIVSLAWFGANIVNSAQSYGTPGFLSFVIGTGLNLAFLLVGLAPAGWLRLGKA